MLKQKSFDKLVKVGRLYLVPTPIGNLQDMTYRAIQTLTDVSVIASEDTRNTQKLLNHFEVKTPQISFHDHNFKSRIPDLLNRLKAGEDIAQVSDAGMPSISDPGHELVVACLAESIPVIALPGATAGVTALIASGLLAAQFTFYGFLERKKKDQLAELSQLVTKAETLIFYESPYRLKATVSNFIEVFGPERQAVICRELTKIHEEYLRGSLEEIYNYLEENDLKGECCLLVSGQITGANGSYDSTYTHMTIIEHVNSLKNEFQFSTNEAIKEVAKLREIKKQEVYKEYHQS